MNSVLQLCETLDANYPDHFQIFLENCLQKHSDSFLANDYLFAAVYFIVLECGFCPVNLYDEFPQLCTDSFDIRKLRCVKSYSIKYMKLVKTETVKYWVYMIPLELGHYGWECELHCTSSVENNTYLVINFILKALGVVKSVCLNTEDFIQEHETAKYSFKLKNLHQLSTLIKDKLGNSIKELIMLHIGQGCCPHLLRLPEDVQKKIIYFLTGNAVDVQNLALTCTYFYNVITNDLELWQVLSMYEFDGKTLNEALEDVMEEKLDENCNIFRMVFLQLKKKKLNKPYRHGAVSRNMYLML